MASSLRLPVGSLTFSARPSTMIPQPYAPIPHIRSFSQVPQRWAAIRSQNFNAPSITQPSMKSRAKDAMQGQAMPNDIGLLPGTFVRPLWRDMPSIFTNPKDVWYLQWTWIKNVFSNFARFVVLFPCWSPARCLAFWRPTGGNDAMAAKLTLPQCGVLYV